MKVRQWITQRKWEWQRWLVFKAIFVLRICSHMRIISVGNYCESVNSFSIGTLATEIKPRPLSLLETGAGCLLSIRWLRDIKYVFPILVSLRRAHFVRRWRFWRLPPVFSRSVSIFLHALHLSLIVKDSGYYRMLWQTDRIEGLVQWFHDQISPNLMM